MWQFNLIQELILHKRNYGYLGGEGKIGLTRMLQKSLSDFHTCDTSRIIREAPGNGADLPDSRKGRKTSRKLNIPITFFFQNCPFFARIYGTDLEQQTFKGLTS